MINSSFVKAADISALAPSLGFAEERAAKRLVKIDENDKRSIPMLFR